MNRRFLTPRTLSEIAISVVPFDGDTRRWNDFVRATPGGTFCHRAEWREVMSETLGHEPLYRVALDGAGRWIGVLPLVSIRSRLFDHYLLSMPFLNYGGPLGGKKARELLARDALSEAIRSDADHLELRARQEIPGELEATNGKVTVLLDLPQAASELWDDHFRSKLRSQIRKPMKEGMETRFGLEQLPAFYEVFSERMRDLGTPVLPRAFFEHAAQLFGDDVVIAAVYHEGQPVAAGYGFAWRDEIEMTWASSRASHDRLAPNMLLYWSFMEYAIERGTRIFNFGRCTPGGGTHRFKKQWGGRDVPLSWLHWSRVPGADSSRPDGMAVRAAVATWQRLPLFVANRAGPYLARNLPF